MFPNRVFIQQAFSKLVPSSIIGETACYVFYDHHPRDERSLDVTVCTNRGEVLEYYQRELISSIHIDSIGAVIEIKILRNSKCELFYLVVTRSEIIILLKKDMLMVHNRVSYDDSFTINDLECTGQASLIIDDIVYNDNFIKQTKLNYVQPNESLPIVNEFTKKWKEAKYTTQHNETKYKDYLNIKQAAAFSLYQNATFNLERRNLMDNDFKLDLIEISNLLQVTVKAPLVKMCNKKIVLIMGLKNNNIMSIKDVCVLLHSDSKQSIEHSTKVFENVSTPPHWKEIDVTIDSRHESTVVAVVDLKELQFDETSRIDFEIALSFTKGGKVRMLPIESVSISPLDIMGDNFDVLFCSGIDATYLTLCILSTSECFNLRLRHIKSPDDKVVALLDIFHTYLKMEKYSNDVCIHKVSPFHKLYGVMVVFDNNIEGTNIMCVRVYTRFPSQLLALMHYMYDAVPYRIIATSSDYKISEIGNDLSNYNENSEEINYKGCASSVLEQICSIKTHIFDCMLKTHESNSTEDQDKRVREIDLMALGVPKYLELKKKLHEENLKAIKSINKNPTLDVDTDCMIIDLQ